MLDCYQAADVFVFASNTEIQGLVLLEALAKGAPVVSTAVMGTRDVLVDGEGCVVAKEEPNDFSTKVISVLKDRQLHRHLSATVRKYAKRWHAPLITKQLAALYAETSTGQMVSPRPQSITRENCNRQQITAPGNHAKERVQIN